MKYCSNCGSEVHENQAVCLSCGFAIKGKEVISKENDNGGFGWGLLGFCVPIVGLILFLIWKDEKPKTSKAAGIGALVSVLGGVIFSIIYAIAIAAIIGSYAVNIQHIFLLL